MSNEKAAPHRGRPRDVGKDEAILKAAGDLFLAKGFEASLDAVAHEAGVSKATIYARYKDKEELFRAVLRHKCESVVTPDSFAPGSQAPVRDTLVVIATRFLDLSLGDDAMGMHKVIVAEIGRASRMAELFFETAVLRMKDRFSEWLASETAAGRLRVPDPDGASWRFLGAVKGEAHLRLQLGLPPIEPDRLRRHIEACADDFIKAYAAAP
jgi:TetR/AcrR family transcriptional regulator, mexJK operon transcriptional repressor